MKQLFLLKYLFKLNWNSLFFLQLLTLMSSTQPPVGRGYSLLLGTRPWLPWGPSQTLHHHSPFPYSQSSKVKSRGLPSTSTTTCGTQTTYCGTPTRKMMPTLKQGFKSTSFQIERFERCLILKNTKLFFDNLHTIIWI